MNTFRSLNWNKRHRPVSQRELFARTPSVSYHPVKTKSLYHRWVKIVNKIHD